MKKRELKPDSSLEDPYETSEEAEALWDKLYAKHGIKKIVLTLEDPEKK